MNAVNRAASHVHCLLTSCRKAILKRMQRAVTGNGGITIGLPLLQEKVMRVLVGLIFLFVTSASLPAQMEPCLTGADTPQCGIKISLNPPSSSPDGNALSTPNEITVDIPVRIKAAKVQLSAGPKEAQASEFKPVT